MALDLSNRENYEIEMYRARMRDEPELFVGNRELVAAVNAEYERRRLGRSNVDANLAAAATPIEPDEEIGPSAWKKFNDAEMLAPMSAGDGVLASDRDAYLAKHAQALRNDTQRMLEETAARSKAGYKDDVRQRLEAEWHANNPEPMSTSYVRNDDGSAYAPMTNFTPGSTVMVNGVRVPAVDLGDGQLRYRLGDVKRAQEAAKDAARAKMFSEQSQRDLANYGTRQLFQYRRDEDGNVILGRGAAIPTTGTLNDDDADVKKYDALSPEEAAQQERLAKRRDMEYRQGDINRALANRPGMQRLSERDARARQLFADTARLARGSQNINASNGAFFNALAMLEGVKPEDMDSQQRAMMQMMPMDSNRAAVEAANNAQLTQLGLRVAQGQGFQEPLPEQRAAARQQLEMQMAPEERAALYRDKPEVHPSEVDMVDAHVKERYSAPGSVWGLGGLSSSFSSDEQQQTIDWLVNEKGYSPAKAQKIVDNIVSKRRGQSWHTFW